jgi:hypothetical protein
MLPGEPNELAFEFGNGVRAGWSVRKIVSVEVPGKKACNIGFYERINYLAQMANVNG